jgi:hypothetical protein
MAAIHASIVSNTLVTRASPHESSADLFGHVGPRITSAMTIAPAEATLRVLVFNAGIIH